MAPPLPPGFVVQGQQTAGAPPLPPGFVVQEQEQGATLGERAMDIGRTALFPHQEIASAVADLPGSLMEAGRSMFSQMGKEGPVRAGQLADLSETEYRMLGRLFGAPIDAPSPESYEKWRKVLVDVLMTGAGGKIGQTVGAHAGDALKYLGRGFRTVPGADRFLAQAAHHGVSTPAQAVQWRELINPTLSGAAVGSLVDAMDPTPYEFTDKPVAGGAGLATAAAVGRNTVDDMLLGNPKWRDIMMRPSSGNAGALIGAILGHYAAQGINLTSENVAQAVDEVERQLEKPADEPPGFYRPQPGRR